MEATTHSTAGEKTMPTYEYKCQECGATYELQESFTAASTHTCRKCERGTAKRVLHAPRIVFKGSGFYVTDNRKGSPADSESSSDSVKSESAAS
jgi:putative FmdB family regulatory protein